MTENRLPCFNDREDLYSRPIWIATLEKWMPYAMAPETLYVYQEDKDSWPDLGKWLTEQNGCYGEDFGKPGRLCYHTPTLLPYWTLTGLDLRFRSHRESLPINKDGYYFAYGCGANFGNEESSTYDIYIAGYLENGIIQVQEWKIPEIVPMFPDTRDPLTAQNRLIWHNGEPNITCMPQNTIQELS